MAESRFFQFCFIFLKKSLKRLDFIKVIMYNSIAKNETQRDVAQFGRALRSGRRGCGFKSRHLDQNKGKFFRSLPLFFWFELLKVIRTQSVVRKANARQSLANHLTPTTEEQIASVICYSFVAESKK